MYRLSEFIMMAGVAILKLQLKDFVLWNLFILDSLLFLSSYTREAYLDLVDNIKQIIPGKQLEPLWFIFCHFVLLNEMFILWESDNNCTEIPFINQFDVFGVIVLLEVSNSYLQANH